MDTQAPKRSEAVAEVFETISLLQIRADARQKRVKHDEPFERQPEERSATEVRVAILQVEKLTVQSQKKANDVCMPLCEPCAAVCVWKNEIRILQNGVFVSVGGNLAPAKKKVT